MTHRWWFTVDCTPTTYIYVKVLMGVSRLPSRGKDLVSVIAGDERKKLLSLSTYEVICKSPKSIEFLQILTSFTKIWTIGPKIESKVGKKRQFTMERPEPHCMTLVFRFEVKWKRYCPILAFFSSFHLSAAAFQVPTYHAMPRSLWCAWVTCARKRLLKSKDLWSAENFISVSNPKWRTKHVACSLDKFC